MAAGTAIKNVIFDMGNVLMRFDGPYFSAQFTDDEEDAAALNRALFASPVWNLLDSGTVSYDTMLRVARPPGRAALAEPRRLLRRLGQVLLPHRRDERARPRAQGLRLRRLPAL